MKFNFHRLISSKKSAVIFSIMLIYPIIDLILLNSQWEARFTPNHSLFLVGNSEGHMMQILFLWFLPIYLLIFVCENYIQDKIAGENNILILKLGKRKYFSSYIFFSFISSFVVILIILLLNMALSYLINNNGVQDPSVYYSEELLNALPFLANQLEHPTITNLLFIFNCSFLVGVFSSAVTSICLLFPSRKYAYFLASILWYLLIMGENSILLLFQPFTEYPLDHLARIFTMDIGLFILIICIAYFYKVKTDEL